MLSAQISDANYALENMEAIRQDPKIMINDEGIPIPVRTINLSVRVLKKLLKETYPPEVTPTLNGTISFEWETDFGHAHLEIGFTKYSMYTSSKIHPPYFYDGKCETLLQDLTSIVTTMNKELYEDAL